MNDNILYYIETRLKSDYVEFNKRDFEQYQTAIQNPFDIAELNAYNWGYVCSVKNRKEYLINLRKIKDEYERV